MPRFFSPSALTMLKFGVNILHSSQYSANLCARINVVISSWMYCR